MSHGTKVFDYKVDGLSYTVTIYEKDGAFFADVNVTEGAMDVNAVYFGDDDFSGPSASLKGPLNMNGGGSQYEGETVQWDGAIKLSDPGLGKAGTGKATFVSPGDPLTIPLDIQSLDEIDFFGIRATSTTTAEGSIKAVSGDPETPEDPDEPEEPTYDKVFFAENLNDAGEPVGGVAINGEAPVPNEFGVPFLSEGIEPTFENYLDRYIELSGDITNVQSVIFYEENDTGALEESFRIDAPDGGFENRNELLDAYDAKIDEMEEAEDLMSMLAHDSDDEDDQLEDDPEATEPLLVM